MHRFRSSSFFCRRVFDGLTAFLLHHFVTCSQAITYMHRSVRLQINGGVDRLNGFENVPAIGAASLGERTCGVSVAHTSDQGMRTVNGFRF